MLHTRKAWSGTATATPPATLSRSSQQPLGLPLGLSALPEPTATAAALTPARSYERP